MASASIAGVSITFGDVVATCALLLSIYATRQTVLFNRRQKQLIENQDRLNGLLVEKESNEKLEAHRANISASFIKLGRNNYRLKIWNQGKAAARNVKLEFPDGQECLSQSDIDSKFPLELLERHQSDELIASIALETKSKHPMKVIWSDDFKHYNEILGHEQEA